MHCFRSAASVDNRPYEVYHFGSIFVAHLIGQALVVAEVCEDAITQALGPSVDLSIWIPKTDGGKWPIGQRPLQLPTCLRRLFGSTLMNIVGPAIEPKFSEHQTAIRGGSCGPNITAVFQQLRSNQGANCGPLHQLWHQVLGKAADACTTIAESASTASLQHQTIAVLADQSKAFERLSIRWVKLVMSRWKISPVDHSGTPLPH